MNKKQLIDLLKTEALNTIQAQAPVRTGNLKDSIKTRDIDDGFEVYIDVNQAEYAPYTTEPWVSPRWRGRENPNLYWDREASADFIRNMKIRLERRK